MTLVPKIWPLLERCVDEGLAYGYRRAHKHTDNPTEQQMLDAMKAAVIWEISEWFDDGNPVPEE